RFLALLELYREGMVGFEQIQPLGELTVRWTGADDASVTLDIDEYGDPAPDQPPDVAEPPDGRAGPSPLAGGIGPGADGAAATESAPAAAPVGAGGEERIGER